MNWLALLTFAIVRVITGLECPEGTDQIGIINSDIGGCGLETCGERYDKSNIQECAAHCQSNIHCKSFTWAPMNGDRNHPGVAACTIYNSDVPNQMWGPQQIMCSRPRLECPEGSKQIGGINADIGGCGLEDCTARYNKQTIEQCAEHCKSMPNCKSYTWAPMDGDRNHGGVTVCTVYDSDVPNQVWSPSQIMCSRPEETMCCVAKKRSASYSLVCNAMDTEERCGMIYNNRRKKQCEYKTCGPYPPNEQQEEEDEEEMFLMNNINRAVVDTEGNGYWMHLLYAFLLSIATVLAIFMYRLCKQSKGTENVSPLLSYNSV